jgi:hypothetical protein
LFISPIQLTTTFQAALTGSSVVDYLAFVNTTSNDLAVTVQDNAGNVFLPAVTVLAGQLMTVPIPEGGMQFVGLQVKAAAPGVVCWMRCR